MKGLHTRPFRLTRWWTKLGLLVVYLLATGLNVSLLGALEAPPLVRFAYGLVVNTLFIIVAVRVSRGAGEPVVPRRPWWRATARPTAGFVLGGLALLLAAGELRLYWVVDPTGDSLEYVLQIVSIMQTLVIAAYLINSSVLLRRLPPEPKPERTRPTRTKPTLPPR
jgi:hypothetical protein